MNQQLKLRDAFNTLLKTEYVNQEDIRELNKFYIDKYNYLFNILGKKNNFIVGRRGTGKTTLLYRAYLECMLSFNSSYSSPYFSDKNNLGIYIDLNKISSLKNDSDENFERDFLVDLINEFRQQVNLFWKPTILETIRSRRDYINKLFDEIKDLIINGQMINIVGNINIVNIQQQQNNLNINANLEGIGVNTQLDDNQTEENRFDLSSIEISVNDFYTKLKEIKESANINQITIFLDEYSSLNYRKQIKMSKLLKKLFDSNIGVYFKIGVIADNYDFGELRLDRDLHELSLDLDKIVSISGSIEKGFESIKNFITELLLKRLKFVINEGITLEDIFNKKDLDLILFELTKSSMGVTRTLGRILDKALQKSMNGNSQFILLSHIKQAINENSRNYYDYFKGMIEKGALPIEQLNLFNDIINRAKKEQEKNKEKQASFFSWDPSREFYLSKLEENYLIHKISDNNRLKDSNFDVDIFAIDYGICLEHKLNYYSTSKEKRQDRDIVQPRFFYEDIGLKYDDFFKSETLYYCKCCDKNYTKTEITLPNGHILKNCFIHPSENLLEIEVKNNKISEYTEEEEKIIGFLSTIEKNESLFARDIHMEIGVNARKIAGFVRKIERLNGSLKRINSSENSLIKYYGNLSDES